METLESVDPTAFNDARPAFRRETKITVHDKAQHAKKITTDNPHILVAAVCFQSKVDRVSQIRKHTSIQSDAKEQLTEDCKDEVAISAQYKDYKQLFINMLLQID